MALPDQTPKLPKWPFLLGDASLLAAAWLIADGAPKPLAGEAIAAIVGCVVLAAIAGAIPFLADYARRQDEALDERQRSLEALARTVSTAAEQIGIAASGFHEIAELVRKNLGQAEQLADRFHEKLPAFESKLEAFDAKIAALRAAAAKVHAATAAKPAPSAPPEPKPADPAVAEVAAAPAESSALAADEAGSAPIPAAAEPEVAAAPKPPARKRAPKKIAEPAPAPEPALAFAERDPEEAEFSQIIPEEAAEAAMSADGATRLLVTAYIGIGNRLFIRGDGPGLNWSKGVPLQFVSIGKWSWETAETSAPVKFKLYKNDEVECTALGSRHLEPGRQQEITASF
jgi:hypothetical protein